MLFYVNLIGLNNMKICRNNKSIKCLAYRICMYVCCNASCLMNELFVCLYTYKVAWFNYVQAFNIAQQIHEPIILNF